MRKLLVAVVAISLLCLVGCSGGGGGGGFGSTGGDTYAGGTVVDDGYQEPGDPGSVDPGIEPGDDPLDDEQPGSEDVHHPEPATMLLFGSGLLGMAFYRIKRKKRD